jgi:hypothetical protein
MHLSTSEKLAEGFQTGQILYLQHENQRLYAETIQIVQPRQLCWARPLALLHVDPAGFLEPNLETGAPFLQDLRQASDLLLPISLFQVAIDTDVIPVITQLHAAKPEDSENRLAQQQLQGFIRQIWLAHPEVFQPQTH